MAFKMTQTVSLHEPQSTAVLWDNTKTSTFLSAWYDQIRRYTTQDQLSFSFVSQLLQLPPYSYPDDHIGGNMDFNELYVKLEHGV
jgi:hypothetical protein